MRAFVREDPDVILVGEIRDGETALEAMRASQTGHLVLSTLHCNDAVDAVQRLFDLGMHENSIASELIAVFAQRLAKRICENCRVASTPAPALVQEIFGDVGPPPGFTTFKGSGCARCRGKGTYGRIGVVEYLPASAAVRRGIAHRLPVDELRAIAIDAGLVPMRDEALALVATGRDRARGAAELVAPRAPALRAARLARVLRRCATAAALAAAHEAIGDLAFSLPAVTSASRDAFIVRLPCAWSSSMAL